LALSSADSLSAVALVVCRGADWVCINMEHMQKPYSHCVCVCVCVCACVCVCVCVCFMSSQRNIKIHTLYTIIWEDYAEQLSWVLCVCEWVGLCIICFKLLSYLFA